MRKKVVIIGSGLGGLSAAVLLAKAGFDVLVLEQSTQIGGCLQCFVRNGIKFETGMHFIGSAERNQVLGKLMRVLEIDDKISLSRLNPDGYDIVSLAGHRYQFANGRQRFIEQMCQYFPDQRDCLNAYWDMIEKVAKSSSLHNLRFNAASNAFDIEYQMRSIDDVVESVFTNPLLAKVIVGNLPLYAAEKGKTPFGTHAFIMDFYNSSAFRIVGGSDCIAKALYDTLRHYGGDILLRKQAKRIVCNEVKAIGVECSDGSFFGADYVISTPHPIRTIEMLEGVHLVRPAYCNRIKQSQQTVGGFAVYLHFKKNAIEYMNYNYYSYTQDSPWNCELYNKETWPKGFLYMHFCHEPFPRYAQAGVVLSYMQMEDVKKWIGTKIGHRGEEYESFKQSHAEKLLNSLEKDFPGITDAIDHYYTSTPLTYLDYTGTEGGSMYGIAKDVHSSFGGRVSHRTRIPNLFLAGQNVNSHGMLGTLVGTIVACSELIPDEQLYMLLKE